MSDDGGNVVKFRGWTKKKLDPADMLKHIADDIKDGVDVDYAIVITVNSEGKPILHGSICEVADIALAMQRILHKIYRGDYTGGVDL